MRIPIGDDAGFADATLDTTGPVALLTLNRPAKLNAMTLAMHRALFRAVRTVRDDPSLKVLVVTGTGRAFCAGDDMMESDPRDGIAPPEAETELAWHNIVREMRAMPKPIVAAVNGIACGAGGIGNSPQQIRLVSASTRARSRVSSVHDIYPTVPQRSPAGHGQD